MPAPPLRLLAASFLVGLSAPLPALPDEAPPATNVRAPWFHHEAPLRRPLMMDGADGLLALHPTDHRLVWLARDDDGWMATGDLFVGLDPVAMAADDQRIYIVNHASDSVVVIHRESRQLIGAVEVGDEPTDALVVDGKLFIACASAEIDGAEVRNVVEVRDADTLALRRIVRLQQVRPRALATNGTHVFIAPQHAGNQFTVAPFDRNPMGPLRRYAGENFPLNPALRSPVLTTSGEALPATGRIFARADLGRRNPPDRDIVALDIATETIAPEASIEVGTSLFALEHAAGALWACGMRTLNQFRFESFFRDGGSFDNAVMKVEATPGGNVEQIVPLFDVDELVEYAFPVAVTAFQEEGRTRLFVACLSSSVVLELDPEDESVVHRLDVAALPCGLALDEARRELHVFSREGLAIQTFDLAETPRLLHNTPLPHDPEPPLIAEGRRHLHDARASTRHGNGAFSCASCHQYGHHDQMAWDLGDSEGSPGTYQHVTGDVVDAAFHPVKGPMFTQSLRHLIDGRPLHHRGDRAFLQSFRGAFRSLQGGDALDPAPMQSLVHYLHTLGTPPRRASGDAETQVRGRALFTTPRVEGTPACATCHRADPIDPVPDAGLIPFGNQHLLAPDLRGVHEREEGRLLGFGLGHEGAHPTLDAYLSRDDVDGVHVFSAYSDEERAELTAYLRQLPTDTHPWIGRQTYLDPTRLDSLDGWIAALTPAFQQSSAFDVTLHARDERGTPRTALAELGGRGVLGFRLDDERWIAWSVLRSKVERGAWTGLLTCVPAEHGLRFALDRDEDGLLDRDERRIGTNPAHPDSDGDGALDGTETEPLRPDLAPRDTRRPRVESHEVRSIFSSVATLVAETDEPCRLEVEVSLPDGTPQLVGQTATFRRSHHLILDGLLPGKALEYRVTAIDRAGNERRATKRPDGTFETPPACWHVADIAIGAGQGGLEAKVTVVDQDGQPVVGAEVRGVWHFGSGALPRIAQDLDAEAVATTQDDGVARVPTVLPLELLVSTATFMVLGVRDPSEEPAALYEHALNRVHSKSITLQ